MSFIDRLREAHARTKSMVCVGLDPQMERIPLDEPDGEEKIVRFCTRLLDGIAAQGIVNTVKPNYAFFAQYGFEGLRALRETIDVAQESGMLVILDAKRGDIGRTGQAYAKEIFDFWDVDAVTVSPYMGRDSLDPFLKYCGDGRGVYVLAKTSNPGAKNLQDVQAGDAKVFEHAARMALEPLAEGTGLVVGATYPEDVRRIAALCEGKSVPLLIPGVGAQGGSVAEALGALRNTDSALHRINSSSGIIYAHEKTKGDFVEAALEEIERLHREIVQASQGTHDND